MKGRYQLASFAKFNRPDPMRDWDWQNPASINLFQYVRNNPISSWDPFVFQTVGEMIDEAMTNAVMEGNDVKGHSLTVLKLAWNVFGVESVSTITSKTIDGEAISLGDVGGALTELPGLGQAKAALKGGKAAVVGAKVSADVIGDILPRQLAKKGDDAASLANKKPKTAAKKSVGFVAGTLILTENRYRAIETIETGDWVWSKDPATGKEALRQVLHPIETYPEALITLTYRIEDQTYQVGGTADHPFWLAELGRFEELGRLRLGDKLYLINQGKAEVVGLVLQRAIAGRTFKTCNFEVEDFHTYFISSPNNPLPT